MSDDEQKPAEARKAENDDDYPEEDEKDEETRAAEEKAAREAARKRCYKYTDPPKVYTDVNVSVARVLLTGHHFESTLIKNMQSLLISRRQP